MSTTKTKPKPKVVMPSKALKKKRFKMLIQYLEHIEETEPDRFDLKNWISATDEDSFNHAIMEWRKRYKKGEPLNCGTAACVAGHLPVIFPGHWDYIKESCTTGNIVYKYSHEELRAAVPDSNRHGRTRVKLSFHHFFGGNIEDWVEILYPDSYKEYPSIDMVLERLNNLYKKVYEQGK